jgi:two-component system, sensor histidine kinase and response regulator
MTPRAQDWIHYWNFIKSIGITSGMDDWEKRKMSIFNQLNFYSIVMGLVLPLIGFLFTTHLPPLAWYAATSPVAIGVFVLWLAYEGYIEFSRMVYFLSFPIVTCIVYLGKVDIGIELFFILYGVMSVFFLHRPINIILSLSFSVAAYLLAVVTPRTYYFVLAYEYYFFFVFNHLVGIGFIFYALYLVKKENYSYQVGLIEKGRELHRQNLEIQRQKQEIGEKAALLEAQTRELTDLNQVKNKLFSVIAHDLKTPMYGLRNLFNSMQQSKMPAREVKQMLPAAVNEMNYTTSLMENLLHWAKTQMKRRSVDPEVLDIREMIGEVLQLLHMQAHTKRIHLTSQLEAPLYCFADREMVNLVLRNLVSNAIKFTPEDGTIKVEASEHLANIEIAVVDTGIGIAPGEMENLFSDAYYTTKGTNSETGTGLGLKLCRDFLAQNGGLMKVESHPGKGSRFSFTLPRNEASKN